MTSKTLSEALEEAFVRARDLDASLPERLQAFADAVRELGPQFQDAVDRLVARLRRERSRRERAETRRADAVLRASRRDRSPRDPRGAAEAGPLAITFNRGHWCPYCRINTRTLAEAQGEIAAEGGQIAAIMPDQQHFTAGLKAESEAPFPILTDMDNGYAMSLNLAFWVGAEMQELMTWAGWDVTRSQGSDTWLLPIPATFVVGSDGKVKARFLDPDYRKRMAVEDLIAALKSAR